MALREIAGSPGAPWERSRHGSLDRLVVESELLAGNPLGDPEIRPLWVYRPPGVEPDHPRPLPAVYVIQGYTGQLDMWASRPTLEPTFLERLDAMFAARECPDAIVVLVDAWTSYGGSQFINSSSTGPYLDYLCDEVVPFVDERYPTAASRDHRGLTGKSSGGYGAMVVPMLRPDVFGALASHAGDALFECCYLPEFAGRRSRAARRVRRLLRGVLQAPGRRPTTSTGTASPSRSSSTATRPATRRIPPTPARRCVPFDIATGRLIDDVWAQWLEKDPVRMAPSCADALRSMRRIYLDAGKSDEYYLDLGAQAFAAELDKLGVAHTLELFDGKHGGLTYRYPGAIRELVLALR